MENKVLAQVLNAVMGKLEKLNGIENDLYYAIKKGQNINSGEQAVITVTLENNGASANWYENLTEYKLYVDWKPAMEFYVNSNDYAGKTDDEIKAAAKEMAKELRRGIVNPLTVGKLM